MDTRQLLRSEYVRRRVQLGVVPVVVGSVVSMGATDLIDLVGTTEAIALLGFLIAVQVFLILARIRFDLLSARA